MHGHTHTAERTRGFTLIELLVVIAIIGVLSTVVLSSMNSARKKARDVRRKADIKSLQTALELHYDTFGTYRVSGSGWSNNGVGWVGQEGSGNYTVAISRALYQHGFLATPIVVDPSAPPGYMLYWCDGGERYSLSATLESAGASDAELQASGLCWTDGGNTNRVQVYGKNYVVGN